MGEGRWYLRDDLRGRSNLHTYIHIDSNIKGFYYPIQHLFRNTNRITINYNRTLKLFLIFWSLNVSVGKKKDKIQQNPQVFIILSWFSKLVRFCTSVALLESVADCWSWKCFQKWQHLVFIYSYETQCFQRKIRY